MRARRVNMIQPGENIVFDAGSEFGARPTKPVVEKVSATTPDTNRRQELPYSAASKYATQSATPHFS